MIEKVVVGICFIAMVLSGGCGLWAAGCETIREAALPMLGMVVFGWIAINISNNYQFSEEIE